MYQCISNCFGLIALKLLIHTLLHHIGYKTIRRGKKAQFHNKTFFCSKNRDPFPVLEQVMASSYLPLLRLPWRNAITQNREATGADIDELSG